jgi:hypothetical protein
MNHKFLALVFSTVCLTLPSVSQAQLGALFGGSEQEKSEESSGGKKESNPLGSLFGGGGNDEADEAEAEPALIPAVAWLAMDDDGQAAYVVELRETYPQNPPIGSKEAAEAAEKKEDSGALGFISKASNLLGGGGEGADEGELVRGLDNEQLEVYLALDSQSRVRYALATEQEALVKVFKAATIEVAQGQSKLLRAFNRNDEAAALEASAALAAADCDTACLEGVIEQSASSTELISELTDNQEQMTEEGKASYNNAWGDFALGTAHAVLVVPVAAEWGPRALNAITEETSAGLTGALNSATASMEAEMAAATMSEEEKASLGEAQQAQAAEANAAMDAMAGKLTELLAPGKLVVTRGLPLIMDWGKLVQGLLTYGKEQELDTSGADEFDFGDI